MQLHVHLLFHFYLELKAIIQKRRSNAAPRKMPNQLAKNKRGTTKQQQPPATIENHHADATMRKVTNTPKLKKQSGNGTTTPLLPPLSV